ncbi:hypothetical protein Fmac_020385 [Flemingia macrophylla]|uniref:Uncharacterized protein n=1 Tax=Flemingia macrophylla TaxID=520843 RepID=A0ABD1LUI3_9FABA
MEVGFVDFSDLFEPVEVIAGLEEAAVGETGVGGAPGVGQDSEGADFVGGEI